MKNQDFLKLLRKSRSNSGFTLMELLVGLFMSIFVVGALGFGLMQVLRVTQSETSKSTARNETSRAIDFISDEIRRAKRIENVATNAYNFTSTGKTVVFALEIPEVTSSFGADNNTSTTNSERIVYYLQSASGTSWRGDQVLYRYGPPLGTNGDYTTGTWQYEALIDNISGNSVTSECPTGTTTPASPTGFYACITSTNTAQLYFTGLTKTVTGSNTDNYAANTQAVARATTAPVNTSDDFASYTWSFKDLGGAYYGGGCSPAWKIRTDFGNNSSDTDDTKKWIRDSTRQPQPIAIDPTKPLTITTSPVGATGCNSRGFENRWDPVNRTMTTTPTNGTEPLSQYKKDQYGNDLLVSHTIDFTDPRTFNGNEVSGGSDYNDPIVKTDGSPTVQFLKNGSPVPQLGAFDSNGDGDYSDPDDQPSLGKFLYDKGLAILDPTSPTTDTSLPEAKFLITSDSSKLAADQRIIAFEVGQTNPYSDPPTNSIPNSGFDLQDNIFIVTSDIFKKTFDSSCFSGSCP